MARLSADEIAAIAAGQPVEQDWTVSVPQASGSSTFAAVRLHSDTGGPYRVTDAGQYTVEGYNVSMAEPGRLRSGMYRFTVDNGDGYLSSYSSTNVWYNTSGSYQADPIECRVAHRVRVRLLSGSWSEILYYVGLVDDVQYDETNGTATIQCRSISTFVLDELWTVDDGTDVDTGLNVVV